MYRSLRSAKSGYSAHALPIPGRSGRIGVSAGVEDKRFAVLDFLETPDPGRARLDALGKEIGVS